nr:immunoglobulin light chain junction region [Macaca mulatta]MOV64860.1 immunoglobulin light chain junction region [Macaca mulatta]
CLQSKNSRTF